MAIRIQINGKTRDISLEDYLKKDIQELIAEDIGYDMDELLDFNSNFSEDTYIDIEGLPETPTEKNKKKKE